jgi:hypothetical protein
MTSLYESALSNSYVGLLQIETRISPGTSNSNLASYLLHVTKVPGQTGVVSVISAQGSTTGGATNHPSFTFSIANDYLTVTPVVATTGAFIFTITALDGIGVYARGS